MCVYVCLCRLVVCSQIHTLQLGIGRIKFSARALDLSYFTRKNKCAFINL